MVPELEYQKAPQENLQTWHRLNKFFLYGVIFIAILLALLVQLVP